jgi:hypothetical protein
VNSPTILEEEATMQTQTQLERDRLVEQKVQKVKELYADAPELGKSRS